MRNTNPVLIALTLILALSISLAYADAEDGSAPPPVTQDQLQGLPISPDAAQETQERERQAIAEAMQDQEVANAAAVTRQAKSRLLELQKQAEQLHKKQKISLEELKIEEARFDSMLSRFRRGEPLLPIELELYQASPIKAATDETIEKLNNEIKRAVAEGLPPDHERLEHLRRLLAELVLEDGTPGPQAAAAWRVELMPILDEARALREREQFGLRHDLQSNHHEQLTLQAELFELRIAADRLDVRRRVVARLEAIIRPEADKPAATQPDTAD